MAGAGRWRRRVRRDWEKAARAWERWEPSLLYSLSAVDPVLIRALELRPGQRVLDFGCGSGDPALALAQWVGPRGSVLGLDVSRRMLATARRRARSRAIGNVRFRAGDITRFRPAGPRFHRAVSRYGLMFAADVPLALRRVRDCLAPGGKVALAVWGPAEKNASFLLATEAIRTYLAEPPPDPEKTPHPLRLGRTGLLPRLLREAGFRAVKVQAVQAPFVHASPEDYARERLEISAPLRNAFAGLPRSAQRRVYGRLVRAVRRYRQGELLRLPATAWVVSGRR